MPFTVVEVRQELFSVFDSLLTRRDEFLSNPSSDFTRKKKISFAQTMLFPMIAGADNVATELLDMFGEEDLPLPSAMIQRRNQVKKEAFQELFYLFNKCSEYRTCACGDTAGCHSDNYTSLIASFTDSYLILHLVSDGCKFC